MKAFVTHNAHEVRFDDVSTPSPASDEVLIRVLAAGICGGDVRIYNGTFPYLNYPIINGHEFSGIIEMVGTDAGQFSRGDYVTAEPIIPCGHCYACSVGKINCCSNMKILGVHVNGCFGEYICVKAQRVYKLPDTIPPETACMIEPYGIGMHALQRLQLAERDSLLIIGAGPIGLSALDLAKEMGVRCMVSDVYEERLEIARKLGADCLINPNEQNMIQAVSDFTQGQGFPAVLEATGVPSVMQATQDYVANGGRICLAGVTNKNLELSVMTFCSKEVTVMGTRNSTGVFPPLIKLFEEKRLHPEQLRTHVFPLECYAQAIELASKNAREVCKVVVKMR